MPRHPAGLGGEGPLRVVRPGPLPANREQPGRERNSPKESSRSACLIPCLAPVEQTSHRLDMKHARRLDRWPPPSLGRATSRSWNRFVALGSCVLRPSSCPTVWLSASKRARRSLDSRRRVVSLLFSMKTVPAWWGPVHCSAAESRLGRTYRVLEPDCGPLLAPLGSLGSPTPLAPDGGRFG